MVIFTSNLSLWGLNFLYDAFQSRNNVKYDTNCYDACLVHPSVTFKIEQYIAKHSYKSRDYFLNWVKLLFKLPTAILCLWKISVYKLLLFENEPLVLYQCDAYHQLGMFELFPIPCNFRKLPIELYIYLGNFISVCIGFDWNSLESFRDISSVLIRDFRCWILIPSIDWYIHTAVV